MSSSAKVLVLFAHPAFEKSRVNRRLVGAIADLEGITFHDLYQTYPDFHINVQREQELLVTHDLIVFHHPFYWYSSPAILKEWQDLVLEHGFAYGAGGEALRGKRVLQVITTGGSAAAYPPDSPARRPVRELLAPFVQTAELCGMAYLPPFVVHGTHRLTEPAMIEPYATAYRALLGGLRDGRLPPEALLGATYLNELADALSPPAE